MNNVANICQPFTSFQTCQSIPSIKIIYIIEIPPYNIANSPELVRGKHKLVIVQSAPGCHIRVHGSGGLGHSTSFREVRRKIWRWGNGKFVKGDVPCSDNHCLMGPCWYTLPSWIMAALRTIGASVIGQFGSSPNSSQTGERRNIKGSKK